MIFQFNSDGTTEGYSTPEVKSFLSEVGEIVITQDAIIQMEKIRKTVFIIAVDDRDGHECPVCLEKKKKFIEVVNEASFKNGFFEGKKRIACKECIDRMATALSNLGQ